MEPKIKIISSRRVYEFRTDDLRLTVITLPAIQGKLRDIFAFQSAQIGTPVSPFGPAPRTFPPGLIFEYGQIEAPGDIVTPVRYLHVDARRIVIDVAGPSAAIDDIWSLLTQLLGDMEAPDGSPVIGTPSLVRDYSDLSFEASADLFEAIGGSVLSELSKSLLPSAEPDMVLVPAFWVRLQRPDEEYPGITLNDPSSAAQLSLRAGTTPNSGRFFSGAPLDSSRHAKLIEDFLDGADGALHSA